MEAAQKLQPDHIILYHFDSCPYCRRVRHTIEDLGLEIEERDILLNNEYRAELIEGGGRSTVPCLRIQAPGGEVRWMYESADIIEFLRENFA